MKSNVDISFIGQLYRLTKIYYWKDTNSLSRLLNVYIAANSLFGWIIH